MMERAATRFWKSLKVVDSGAYLEQYRLPEGTDIPVFEAPTPPQEAIPAAPPTPPPTPTQPVFPSTQEMDLYHAPQ